MDLPRARAIAGPFDRAQYDSRRVDPGAGRRGIATALLDRILSLARDTGVDTIEADASITARAFFERHGFVVVEQRTPVVRDVSMTNFKMRRSLA